jgi:hypothetical protein
MAKQPITKLTTDLNNIQALPDVIIGQAVSLKATFDESGNEIKTYVNTVLTEELNGSDGANKIGLTNPNLASDNVGDGVEEVRQIAVQAQGGTILPNSITNEQLSADVKVGSLGSLTTTDKTSVTASINELDAEVGANTGNIATNTANISTTALNLDILRTAKITTGSSVALTVDTDGTFDLTRNGNILHIIPNVTSTGSMTINVDGQGAIGIRKADDAGTLVALEAGDIKINVPTQLVRDTVNNFFVYAPRGGSNIKSIQRGATSVNSTSQDVVISSINSEKSIVCLSFYASSGATLDSYFVTAEITSDTTITFKKGASFGSITVDWLIIEYNNVKSKQSGTATITSATSSTDVSISSINISKSISFASARTTENSTNFNRVIVSGKLTSDTNIQLNVGSSATANRTVEWQVIEFN